MSYLQQEQQLQAMVGQGKMMEAFERFYDDDVEMVEATGESWKGKESNRKREEEWLKSVDEMHGGGVTGIASNEDEGTTMTESWIDVTMNGQRFKMEEVSVKQWEGDKIVHERFYYNVPGQ